MYAIHHTDDDKNDDKEKGKGKKRVNRECDKVERILKTTRTIEVQY